MAHPVQGAPATPTAIPWPPGLTLKFGDVVRLTANNLGPDFPPGEIVYITTWCDTVVSPQVLRADWVRTDANVLYGFAKKVAVEDFVYCHSPQNGKAGAPGHQFLTLLPDIESTSATTHRIGSRVYLQKTIQVSYRPPGSTGRPLTLQAEPGTRCIVTRIVTRIDSTSPPDRGTSRSVKNRYYAVQVKVSVFRWVEVRQPLRKEFVNFQALPTLENQTQYYSARKLPNGGDPRVVSVTDTDMAG